jgi:hypothetical protein
MSGATLFAAMAMPLIKPAPPIGTTMVRTSESDSKISNAIVPAPAITSGWLYGEMNGRPVSRANAFPATSASS